MTNLTKKFVKTLPNSLDKRNYFVVSYYQQREKRPTREKAHKMKTDNELVTEIIGGLVSNEIRNEMITLADHPLVDVIYQNTKGSEYWTFEFLQLCNFQWNSNNLPAVLSLGSVSRAVALHAKKVAV